MSERSELHVFRSAHPGAARPLRHALASFLSVLEVNAECADDILMAVGEALANALEHAYDEADGGTVELYARTSDEEVLSIDVVDRGQFIERDPRPGRGFGLRIVKTVARAVTLDTKGGTRLNMLFDIIFDQPELAKPA